MDITITNITSDGLGFQSLKSESISMLLNMLHRLEENWLNEQNRLISRAKNC